MARKVQKLLAVLVVMSMCMSLLSFQALAAEEGTAPEQPPVTTGTVDVESIQGGGQTEAVDVTITVNPSENTTEKETAAGGDTTESGLTVNYESTETKDDAGNVTSGESSYTVSNSNNTYGAQGGSETKTEQVSPSVTVDVPLSADDPETEVKENVATESSKFQEGTVPTHDGNNLKKDNPATYDQTTTTVQQGSVSVTSNGITVTTGSGLGGDYTPGGKDAQGDDIEIGLNPIQSKYTGNEKDVHLWDDEFGPNGTAPDGYDLYFSGYEEDGEIDTIATLTDKDGNVIGTEDGDIIQFELKDAQGNVHTTYCVDLSTGTKGGWWYRVENLEDADYYSDKDAEHIRAIALNGYWGVEPVVKVDETGAPVLDDEGNKVFEDPNPTGSMAAFRENLKADKNCPLTDEQIDALSEGQAMAATQIAIWTYGNQENGTLSFKAAHQSSWKQAEYADECAVVDQLAAYLASLSMTEEEAGTTDVITTDKFIDSMSITVGDKIENHENNQDTDNANDAYNVDLTFAMVVEPSQENDDLIVKILDGNGKMISFARIAGVAAEGESEQEGYTTLKKDGNSYTFEGLHLIEGENIDFNLKLEGAQYLEQGVYIYTSEVRGESSSQTFVGIAEGYQDVDITMSVDLSFNVEEGTITTERVWRTEWTNSGEDTGDDDIVIGDDDDGDDDDGDDDDDDDDIVIGDDDDDDDDDFTEIGDDDVPLIDMIDDDVPLVDMIDEEVPLAEIPATGDNFSLWAMISLISGIGLIGLNFFGKKREEI